MLNILFLYERIPHVAIISNNDFSNVLLLG